MLFIQYVIGIVKDYSTLLKLRSFYIVWLMMDGWKKKGFKSIQLFHILSRIPKTWRDGFFFSFSHIQRLIQNILEKSKY